MVARRTPQPKKYFTCNDLCDRWGVSLMFIERKIRTDPTFPTYMRLGDGPKAKRTFDIDDVEAYERSRVAPRRHVAA
jgi:hypothetical protein